MATKKAINVGDRVLVKDNNDDKWLNGVVKTTAPITVMLNGIGAAYKFDQVKLETADEEGAAETNDEANGNAATVEHDTEEIDDRKGVSAMVDRGLSKFAGSIAKVVTSWPITTIIVMTIVYFGLLPGMITAKMEKEGDKLWAPQDTVSQSQKVWVRDTFGSDERRAQAFSDNGGANLLTRASLEGLKQLQDGAMLVTAKCDEGSCKGRTITFQDVRYKVHSSVLSIWGNQVPPASYTGADILSDINDQNKWKTSDGESLTLDDMLGGVTYDSNGNILTAAAFRTAFWVKNNLENVDDSLSDPATDAWELKYDDYVRGFTHAALSKNIPWTKKGEDQEGGDALTKDVSKLGIGYILLFGFSIIVMSNHRLVSSNGFLALISVVSVGMSIVATFGLCSYMGLKQNPVTGVLMLVLLGIGADDGYVIAGEYANINDPSPKNRVVRTMIKAGSSITVTSVTDTVAFVTGAASSLPALRDFCLFAAVGIVFDFLFQSTFFVAILYLRARCQNDNRPDWACCTQVSPERTGFCRLKARVCSRDGQHVCCPCTRDTGKGGQEGLVRRALNFITKLTLTPIGMAVVGVITLGLLAGAIAGLPQLKTDFDIQWFTPDDSPYQDLYDIEKKYFPSEGLPVYIYTKSGSYHQAHNDGSLTALYQRVLSDTWIQRSVSNWYLDFIANPNRNTASKVSESAFATQLHNYVNTPDGSRYQKDIIFIMDGNGVATGVRATRAFYLAVYTTNGGEDIKMIKSTRDAVGGSPLDAFPFSNPYVFFDGLDVVAGETIQNVLIACGVVFVVMLVMLGDIAASLIVLLMVGLVDVCMLGYMAHWNCDFNSVTAINCVIAVGLSVDYSAHIAHSFLAARGSGFERAAEAVDHIGMSVYHGGMSTLLAVLPLCMSQSYVFRILFKMWFMIITFGCYFGLIVLPVVLALLGRCIGAQVPRKNMEGIHAGKLGKEMDKDPESN